MPVGIIGSAKQALIFCVSWVFVDMNCWFRTRITALLPGLYLLWHAAYEGNHGYVPMNNIKLPETALQSASTVSLVLVLTMWQ